jgi:hypothetical protein
VAGDVRAAKQAFATEAAGTMYQNFAETPVGAREIFGDALPRLRAIKDRWDPTNVIRANHPVAAR